MHDTPTSTSKCWHDLYFHIAPYHPQPPHWQPWIDLFLLDAVLGGFVRGEQSFGLQWLLHRRCGPTGGHEFKFSCYCTRAFGDSLNQLVTSQPAFRLYFDELAVEQPDCPKYELMRSDSETRLWREWDPNWRGEFFRPYGYFIQGISRALFEFIDAVIEAPSAPLTRPVLTDPHAVATFYFDLQRRITALWTNDGHEPFLHQLSAMFAYEPILCAPRAIDGMQVVF